MRMLRIALSGVAAAVLLLCGANAMAQAAKVTVGVFPWEPYVSKWQEGHGMLTEMLTAALKAGQYEAAIRKESFAKALELLQGGEIDLVPGVSRTEERARTIDFTSDFYVVDMTVVFRKGAIVYETMKDLKNSLGGVMEGTFWMKMLDQEGIRYETSATQQQNIRKLIAGNVDFVCMPKDVAVTIMRQLDEDTDEFEFVCVKRDGQPVGVSKKTRFKTLRDDLEKGLAAIKSDGTYDAIVAKYR